MYFLSFLFFFFFFFNDTATTEIYTLSLHDALPISFEFSLVYHLGDVLDRHHLAFEHGENFRQRHRARSEEHTSELQSPCNLVCRLLLEKKKQPLHRIVELLKSVSYTRFH